MNLDPLTFDEVAKILEQLHVNFIGEDGTTDWRGLLRDVTDAAAIYAADEP